MVSRLINSFWDFIKRPALAAVILIPPAIGISEYNRSSAIENEIFNFRYHVMEARVMNVDYPLTGNMRHILLPDGSKITRGRLISDIGDTINISDHEYFINGVEQR